MLVCHEHIKTIKNISNNLFLEWYLRYPVTFLSNCLMDSSGTSCRCSHTPDHLFPRCLPRRRDTERVWCLCPLSLCSHNSQAWCKYMFHEARTLYKSLSLCIVHVAAWNYSRCVVTCQKRRRIGTIYHSRFDEGIFQWRSRCVAHSRLTLKLQRAGD